MTRSKCCSKRCIYMYRVEGGKVRAGYVDWDKAKIHVLSHVIHYSSGVFEGIRGYVTDEGVAIFRGRDHYRRLIRSAKIYRMLPEDYAPEDLKKEGRVKTEDLITHFMDITKDLIRDNDLYRKAKEVKKAGKMKNPFVYIRPVIYRGYDVKEDPILSPPLGVNPLNNPVEWFIATFLWDDYLGKEAIERGADVITSAWAKNAPSTTPFMAKGASNYATGQLAKMEAVLSAMFRNKDVAVKVKDAIKEARKKNHEKVDLSLGLNDLLLPVESIQLTVSGHVAEGTGENVFVVMYEDGDPAKATIYTPPLSASILPGITRDSIMTIIRDLRKLAPFVESLIGDLKRSDGDTLIPRDRLDDVEKALKSVEEIRLVETMIPREMLYIADEVFFTGTAAEVTPIRSVDGIPVGEGKPGPITLLLRLIYTSIAFGRMKDENKKPYDPYGWVEEV